MLNPLNFGLIMAMVAIAGMVPIWADPSSQVGRLNLIIGGVSFQSGSQEAWGQADLNYPLTQGDRLWTDQAGRAELHLSNAVVRLDSGSDFSFLSLDDHTIQVSLVQGSMNVVLRALETGSIFEIDTPDSTIRLVERGNYRIDVQESGETRLAVQGGSAELTAGQAIFGIGQGQSTQIVSINRGGSVYNITALSSPDEWDNWCRRRDDLEARLPTSNYVSMEMIGREDLDVHGTWQVVAGLGPLWSPNRVAANWAPYRDGHWSWVEPWGWTWIDDNAWGFAPFHYGRWTFYQNHWVWLPGIMAVRPVYAPALVVFVGGNGWSNTVGGGIGWFPLGPREAYYPPYFSSAAYIQRINREHVVLSSSQASGRLHPRGVVYANRQAPRGVTVVSNDNFTHSRPAGRSAIPLSARELSQVPFMGMTAEIAPRPESVSSGRLNSGGQVARPPMRGAERRVHSRVAPAAPRIPFAHQQQDMVANPGRPIDAAAEKRLRQTQPGAHAPVKMVDSGSLKRVPQTLPKRPAQVTSVPRSRPMAPRVEPQAPRLLPQTTARASSGKLPQHAKNPEGTVPQRQPSPKPTTKPKSPSARNLHDGK